MMAEKRAIVTGHRGMDGRLLVELLQQRGGPILGVGREGVETFNGAPRIECRLDSPKSIAECVRGYQPDEIYYVAAHHDSSQGKAPEDLHDDYRKYLTVNVEGPLAFLDAIRAHAPKARFVYASTSLIFGNSPREVPQVETTAPSPEEPYAMVKLLGGQACKDFRSRGIFASVAILFNHESAYRRPHFLSMKIVLGALAARAGKKEPLVLGDLDATVDWGYAPDFVDAMRRMLAIDTPGDFIVATGEAHTVRDFAAAAYAHVGLDWQKHVTVDPSLLSRRRSGRVGSFAKLKAAAGWAPTLTFEQMVQTLIDQTAARK